MSSFWVVFPSKGVKEAIGETPDGVSLSGGVMSHDGRNACKHDWSEVDTAFFNEKGFELAEQLPEDWQYPQSEY